MEWIIAIVVVWILWVLLTGKSRRESLLRKEILNAYFKSPGDVYDTSIYWEAAEQFAKDRGAKVDSSYGGGQAASFEMKINNELVSVIFTKDRLKGTVFISVENLKDQQDRFKKEWGI